MDCLDDIRASCHLVAAQAEQVRIIDNRLAEYAVELAREPLESLQMDPQTHFLGEGEETVAFLLVLDAVNFGSGYFPSIAKYPGQSGYFTFAGALAERFRVGEGLTAPDLAKISGADCARIFGQDPGHPPAAELMELFAAAWRELGEFLLEHFEGRFSALVEAAAGAAERLVTTLARIPSFQDVYTYHELRVPFFKRAQIAAADLYIAFGGQGPGFFADIDRLTVFADNLLPHVLRTDGVLQYGRSLSKRIAQGDFLPAGSSEEVEIRACTVEAAERLVGQMRRLGRQLDPLHLDNYLWHRGQQMRYRLAPRHRTLSCHY